MVRAATIAAVFLALAASVDANPVRRKRKCPAKKPSAVVGTPIVQTTSVQSSVTSTSSTSKDPVTTPPNVIYTKKPTSSAGAPPSSSSADAPGLSGGPASEVHSSSSAPDAAATDEPTGEPTGKPTGSSASDAPAGSNTKSSAAAPTGTKAPSSAASSSSTNSAPTDAPDSQSPTDAPSSSATDAPSLDANPSAPSPTDAASPEDTAAPACKPQYGAKFPDFKITGTEGGVITSDSELGPKVLSAVNDFRQAYGRDAIEYNNDVAGKAIDLSKECQWYNEFTKDGYAVVQSFGEYYKDSIYRSNTRLNTTNPEEGHSNLPPAFGIINWLDDKNVGCAWQHCPEFQVGDCQMPGPLLTCLFDTGKLFDYYDETAWSENAPAWKEDI